MTEKHGYQPVFIDEWRCGVCDKKKIAECLNRNSASLGSHYIYRFLEGKDENGCDMISIYAIMLDNNFFLCTDFDSICYTSITKSVPTLFDDLGELDLSNNEEQIFNGKTYFRPFAKGLVRAKRSIVISSHKLYAVQCNNVVNMLKRLSANGVEIMILT